MRRPASISLGLTTTLTLGLGLGACFTDPVASDAGECNVGEQGCMCSAEGDCFGGLSCIDGLCVNANAETTGDGDGDPGDGDGDGDGDPGETVVVDLFSEACGVTTTWSTTASGMLVGIPCDQVGTEADGWMVRYPELTIGDDTFSKVIGITAPTMVGTEVRGLYNLDEVSGLFDLEFRAEVLLRCADADPDTCVGKFALAIAEGVPNGLYAEADDRQLMSGSAPIPITLDMMLLVTLSEPSLGLSGTRTDMTADPSPEVLIVNPRLVLP